MQQKWNQNFDGEPMTDIPQKFLNAGCNVYMVMQLRHDEKIFDERFASMRELHRRGKTPDPEHYEVTYYADLPSMWQDVPNNVVLEELFQVFNLSRPQDFEGHSLSVSFKWNCGGSKLNFPMLKSPPTFRLRWTAF